MLDIKELNVSYGDIHVLWETSLRIEHGKIVALVGSNGAGKTTLLKTISGLLTPDSGKIVFNGEDIAGSPPEKIIKKKIIHIPEGRKLFPEMSVEENLIMGAYSRKDNNINIDLDNIYSIFPKLQERRDQKSGSLSGGEQQMLAMGKGLMGDPELLLIDEMSLGLAPVIVDDLIKIIKDLNEKGKTIFLIEQDVQLALENSDYAYVMDTGRIVLEGDSGDLLKNPEVKKAYLGI
ncbi:MAG: ABC transporter ATP-binding protein [Acidobacteriota bacterium]